jgi:hypothetical protein
MPEVWAVIVAGILLLILYGIVSSKLKARRQRKQREKSLPFVDDNIRPGVPYNVHLSDGKKYFGAQIVGTSDSTSGQFSIGGWEGMLVLMQSNGKRVFVRQSSVRCVEEA